MSDYLEQVGEELQTGNVSAQAMVLLFRAAEEAEQRHDLQALERALDLAKHIAHLTDDALRAEAERLIMLCEKSLERVQRHVSLSGTAAADNEAAICPGCGRPLPLSAVRCHACGHLLV